MTKRVALVTGAAAGIGAEISRRLAKDDMSIGVLDVNMDDAVRVAEEIKAAGGTAIPLQASIADRTQVIAAVTKLREAFGPVTVLINNAGITGFLPFEEITDQIWDRMMEVNLKGTFIVTQVVLPDMRAARWGRIVNISSSSAQTGAATMVHYSSSKGGMIAFTKSIAQEFGKLGITCNTVPPRFVMGTVMSEKSVAEGKISRDPMIQAGPILRAGEPRDIAGACAYLVSEEAGYVTGQIIGVNGGRVIS
jgi:2-hydroxycyclohexanecarboxyl-CoA dehydrogenase